MVASWDGDLDERESMSGYILTHWQRSYFSRIKKANLADLLKTEAGIQLAM